MIVGQRSNKGWLNLKRAIMRETELIIFTNFKAKH